MKKDSMRQTCDLFMLSVFVVAIFVEISLSAYAYNEVHEEKTETKEIHYLTDEELSLLYMCKEDVNCDTCLVISQEDAERLMKIAVVEDYTSAESQANIMAVILNRVASPDFPDSVEGVIRQKDSKDRYQLNTVKNGKYDRAEPNVDSHLALAMIESGQVKTDAMYFEASWAKDTWQSRNLTYVSTVGATRYYR